MALEDKSPKKRQGLEGERGRQIHFPRQTGRIGSSAEMIDVLLREMEHAEPDDPLPITREQFEILSNDFEARPRLRQLRDRYTVIRPKE
ncbi:MAG: hypothetical protein GF416_05880 [Candidatus Altiarchaeales archaeon]|nr:hypothetical protein [Candidatus Altiarchaeales archaeon]MBD3416645.1 hypothetical protein [Candidatus Altiarchaeales archaeon]